jgi:hypothetical protein
MKNNFEGNQLEETRSIETILRDIEDTLEEYRIELKGVLDSNKNLKKAYYKYFDDIDEFTDFTARVWSDAAVGGGKEYIKTLHNNITASPERHADAQEMERAVASLKERKDQILGILSQDFQNEEEAFQAVEKAHKEFILRPLESDQIIK